MTAFDLARPDRESLLQQTLATLLDWYENGDEAPIGTIWSPEQLQSAVAEFTYQKPTAAAPALDSLMQHLKNFTIHTTNSNYFGLFNPRANFPSILADIITAFFNPQLAAWSHAPYAAEIERNLILQCCSRFGYVAGEQDGTFTSGGAESNMTAMICALHQHFPNYGDEGLFAVKQMPVIYCSAESHHSLLKATRSIGLGAKVLQVIPCDPQERMDMQHLKQRLILDEAEGKRPIMVVGTAGTTGSGAIDDLDTIAAICKVHNCWFHVDAAYGGALMLSSKYGKYLSGIEKSDSITMDIHKWFSVPMGISLFLTSNTSILHRAFDVSTAYMPEKGQSKKEIDPYVHSLQWSRRFMGLKMHLPLLLFGWKGYEEVIHHQIEQGQLLRKGLEGAGWEIKNHSDLPILCFSHPSLADTPERIQKIVDDIVVKGKAWISTYPIKGAPCIRACITNYNTGPKEVQQLVELLSSYL
ncbi:MAG: aminotransferase class V-fold PLP-dependent enzyme [Saprospiraceae bacterium]|nr:aminotransferase class V-fold PLP-dependent enzyme [Saprospiraceae bacterium]